MIITTVTTVSFKQVEENEMRLKFQEEHPDWRVSEDTGFITFTNKETYVIGKRTE